MSPNTPPSGRRSTTASSSPSAAGRQIASLTMGYETPQFDNAALRVVASGWRASGIMSARSGDWLTVTTTQDLAGTGVTGQRVNQVNDNPYGDKTLTSYLNAAAFAFPA